MITICDTCGCTVTDDGTGRRWRHANHEDWEVNPHDAQPLLPKAKEY